MAGREVKPKFTTAMLSCRTLSKVFKMLKEKGFLSETIKINIQTDNSQN